MTRPPAIELVDVDAASWRGVAAVTPRRQLYASLGFVETGEREDDEVVARRLRG